MPASAVDTALPHVLLLSIPGLRHEDLPRMPTLSALAAAGRCLPLAPSLPALTCPVQAALTTGAAPSAHGIVANGVFDRSSHHLEMWISPDSVHHSPRLWDMLKAARPEIRTAAWFALQSKHATADLVCLPAPKHNPDGTETMWCHTRPEPLYAALREQLGEFPLHRFWGPIAGIESSRWIVRSFLEAARGNPPHFSYVYLPHLDYAAQRSGPESPQALAACGELDAEIAVLLAGLRAEVGEKLVGLVAGEYRIHPVSHTLFPNRVLREAGLVAVTDGPDGELLDTQASRARWLPPSLKTVASTCSPSASANGFPRLVSPSANCVVLSSFATPPFAGTIQIPPVLAETITPDGLHEEPADVGTLALSEMGASPVSATFHQAGPT